MTGLLTNIQPRFFATKFLPDGIKAWDICRVSEVRYSLVVPFFNEAGNILPLMVRTFTIFRSRYEDFEAVLVDDGSTDGSAEDLDAIATTEPRCHVIHFPRNCGQAVALYEGLAHVQGEIVLTMDGDGQNDPADFPRLLEKLEGDGIDLVCGIRTPRHDSLLRRAMSLLANRVRGRLLGDELHDAGCQLRVFRRSVISALRPSPLLQAFLPAMAAAAGFRLAEMPVQHHPRQHGASKYGLGRLWWRPAREMLRLWVQLRLRRPPR